MAMWPHYDDPPDQAQHGDMIRPGETVIVATENGVHRGLVTVVEELRSPVIRVGIDQFRTKTDPITTTLTIDITEYQE